MEQELTPDEAAASLAFSNQLVENNLLKASNPMNTPEEAEEDIMMGEEQTIGEEDMGDMVEQPEEAPMKEEPVEKEEEIDEDSVGDPFEEENEKEEKEKQMEETIQKTVDEKVGKALSGLKNAIKKLLKS